MFLAPNVLLRLDLKISTVTAHALQAATTVYEIFLTKIFLSINSDGLIFDNLTFLTFYLQSFQ